ncbi:MAG: sulfatase-like hydrolase/transferase [Rubripirellula sp.]|nr:sulfatase-like hydrolase/transferase [Rubripirellula sp.]
MRRTTLLCCSVFWLAALVAEAAEQRPNIVILLADDLGSKDIGCDGGPVKTPALDKLAAEGVRFTDFHSGAPVCSTARATLLTGRHHLRTGVYTVIQDHIHNMHLLESEVTIAEQLKANGYATVHLGKWHLGTPFRGMKKPWIDEHGFDYWFATDLNAAPSHHNPKNFWRNRKRVGELKGYACQLVVDEAITWLDEKRDGDKPFFLNIWFHEPHAPLAAPDDIVRQYGELNDPAAIYSATIDNTDRAIARLVKKLDQIGSLDNTIIIYTSDHGSYRQERNGNLHAGKGSLMEGGTRTPGIIHWPNGIKGGRVESTPAGAVDLLPTICGLVGVEKPSNVHLDGTDLSPLLTSDATSGATSNRAGVKRHQPLTWHSPLSQPVVAIREGKYSLVGKRDKEYPKDENSIQAVMADMRVILEEKYDRKLSRSELLHEAWNGEIKTAEWKRLRSRFVMLNTFQEAWIPQIKAGSGGITRFQLYDLSTDPGQQKDIAKHYPEMTKRLTEQLLAINARVLQEAPTWEPVEPATTGSPANGFSAAGFSAANSNSTPVGDDVELERLLTKIDQATLPAGYDPSQHQAYVDARMSSIQSAQRGRVGKLWKEARRIHPEMQNAGMSFVRILEYVAAGENFAADVPAKPQVPSSTPRSGSLQPRSKSGSVVSEIDPKGMHWHQWRGPHASGVSRTAKPPLEWSEDRNIKWKVAIEGKGNASPIVWGDKVFLLTAIDTGRVDPSLPKPEDQPKRVFGITHPNTIYRFEVLCLDRNTGKELWRQTASEHVPHEGTHNDADFASASPTTDGSRLYCWFGSAGLHCFDLDGKKLWERQLGKAYIGASLGEGCSPVVHKERLVILRDQSRQSTIEVLDAKTGGTLWKKNRDEPNAWATPLVVEHSGRTQVITAASKLVRSYDLDTGDVLWQCGGLTGNVTPCPVVKGDVVYCMSGYEGYSLLALPLDAKGDISGSESIRWSIEKGTPYVPSPVLYEDRLYFTQSNQGILSAINSENGDAVIQRSRLSGISNIYSSPVGADGRVYFTGRDGTTLVIKHADELEVLTTNKLADQFNASPAIIGSQILLRGRKSLYCIEDSGNAKALDAEPTTIEQKMRIHRLSTAKRSVFDAFWYLNRLPDERYDEETADDFAGRVFGRLANQEGRILLKAPPGMNLQAYKGFKTFLRYEGTASVGNCSACHAISDFTDGRSHVVTSDGKATLTSSLRNTGQRKVDLQLALRRKLEMSRLKKSGAADGVSDEYSVMRLNAEDVLDLIAFLQLLDDVSDERFRELVLTAEVLDTLQVKEAK